MTTIMVNMTVVSSMAFDASNIALLQCGSYMRSVEYYYYNTSMDCILRCHITLSDTAQSQTQTLLAGRCNNRENKKRRQNAPASQRGCVDAWDVRSTVTATAFEACLEIKRKNVDSYNIREGSRIKATQSCYQNVCNEDQGRQPIESVDDISGVCRIFQRGD